MGFKMSWKNAQRNRVVEAGQYHVQVKGWKPHEAVDSGNDCVIFEHTIIGPVDSPEIGQTVSDFITLTEAAAWKLGWFVGACGIIIADLPDMDTGSEEFQRILNTCKDRRLWVQVTKGVHKNKDVNKITDYTPDDDQEEVEVVEEVPDFIANKMKRDAQAGKRDSEE